MRQAEKPSPVLQHTAAMGPTYTESRSAPSRTLLSSAAQIDKVGAPREPAESAGPNARSAAAPSLRSIPAWRQANGRRPDTRLPDNGGEFSNGDRRRIAPGCQRPH